MTSSELMSQSPRSPPDRDDDSGSRSRILHIEKGQRYFLEVNDELPYKLIKNLGYGSSAIVEEVQDQWTGAVFARKFFKISGSHAERKRIFDNEVKVIQRLAQHHHIINVFATYVAKREVGLILSPVASRGSLDTFLLDAREGSLTTSELDILHRSFGCLASGLDFMHTQKVRHKDIKPHNILVHGDSFIYTDFGSSLDYSACTRSVTTGRPDSLTRRYAAPEVHDHSPRSSKSDIFSLGCVYLEILCALGICHLPKETTPYGEHTEEIRRMIREGGPCGDTWIEQVIDLTCLMLDPNYEGRPSAKSLTSLLWETNSDMFCKQCRCSLPMSDVLTAEPRWPSVHGPSSTTSSNEADFFAAHVANYKPSLWLLSSDLGLASAPLACSVCGEVFKCRSDQKKHTLRHEKPFVCDLPGCKRDGRGFTTINDLDRHRKSVHHIGLTEQTYRCVSESCRNKEKIWPRLDNYKQHLRRVHKNEDHIDLIKRSVFRLLEGNVNMSMDDERHAKPDQDVEMRDV